MLIKTMYNKNLVRDCQKITFVTLNVFCNPPPPPPPPASPVLSRQHQPGWNTKEIK